MIYIENEEFRLSALTDRAQAGSSVQEGEIQLMIDRKMVTDDQKGVDESLKEPESSKEIKHVIFLEHKSNQLKSFSVMTKILVEDLIVLRGSSQKDKFNTFEKISSKKLFVES